MIKYYKELERPADFTLTLESNPSDGFFNLSGIAFNFINKYSTLISKLNEIDLFIRIFKAQVEEVSLALKNYFDHDGSFNVELYQADRENVFDIIEAQKNMPSIGIIEDSEPLIYILDFYITTLKKIFYFYPCYKDPLNSDYLFLVNARNDLLVHTKFIIKHPKKVTESIKIPNSWYITNYGDLYNNIVVGHSETASTSPFKTIKDSIYRGETLTFSMQHLLKSMDAIKKTATISLLEYGDYLNISLMPANIITRYDEPGVMKVYDPNIVMLTLGVISAQAGLYSFFEYFQRSVENPRAELEKLEAMTVHFLPDILVRCAGFHKVESIVSKTITTSSLTPFELLKEYIIRGWDVFVIPPIIVNKEKGVVEELNTDSLFVQKHIEKDIKKYELYKKTEGGCGKIELCL